ncbi:hypothetical protein [Streptomyces sp. NPDC001401]|uniref:hypothetical protein n=1 Tax=Streptomyces sp. NPDC001401 TaxID=3364570 RepID=UPI00368D26B0
MGRRRALLIGASDYEAPGIASLSFVPADLAALGEALERRGFEVTVPTPKRQVGRNFVNVEMARFLKRARTGDALLVCLSGHGVHSAGQDYFVPEDAHPEIEPFEDGCVAIDWKRDLERSLADHIVILVDACREGIERDAQALSGITGWSRRKVGMALRRKVAYVYACSPGQVARFVGPAERVQEGADCGTRPGESFSLFSRAVSDVLLHHPGALNLSVFQGHVQARVEELHRAYGKTDLQQLRVVMHAAGDPDDFTVVGPAPEADGDDAALALSVRTAVGTVGAVSAIPDADGDTDPGVRLARALYSFQLHGDTEPLLDFAVDGPAQDVVQLAAVVPESVRAQIWSTCALRRPAAALCELRRVLRQAGESALELSLLNDALRRRAPHEVLRDLDADEVSGIVGHVTRTYPAPAVVSLLDSLLQGGLATEAGLLLYGTARCSVDQLPSLVVALRRAGLMRAADHVLAHCGRHCQVGDVPALLALLRSTGRRSDTERVLDAVAGRPTAEQVGCLTELRAVGQHDDAASLLTRAVTAGTDTVAPLAKALIQGKDTAAAALLLDTAAARLPVSLLTELLRLWAEEGPEAVLPQLLLMDGMVRARDCTDVVRLMRALNARWLDRQASALLGLWTKYRPMTELPKLVKELSKTGHEAECAFVLATVAARRPPQTVSTAFTALVDAGLGVRAEQLVWTVVDRRPEENLSEACAALRRVGAGAELRRAVTAAVADPYRSVLEVLPALRALSTTEPARRLGAPDSRAVLRTALRQRPVADLAVLARALSDQGDAALGTWLRQEATDRLPSADLADLVLTLHAAGAGGEWQELLRTVGARRPAQDLGPLVEALYGGNAPGTVVLLQSVVVGNRTGADLSLFVRALRTHGREKQAEDVLAMVGERHETGVVATLVRELTTDGSPETAVGLAELAAARRPLDDVIALVTELLDAGADAAAQRLLEQLAVRSPRIVLKAVRRLLENGRHDAVRRLLRAAAGLCAFDDLRRLLHHLREAGVDEAADLAADALGAVRDPSELALFLGEESTPPYDERERVMSSAARSRQATDLLVLAIQRDATLRDWVLESLGMYCPVPVMAEMAEALFADDMNREAVSILVAAREHGRLEDLVSLLQSAGITDDADASGSTSRLEAAFLSAVREFSPLDGVVWARRLREAGLNRLASQVLRDVTARSAEELCKTLKAAQEVEWDANAQDLLEEIARSGGMGKLTGAWRKTDQGTASAEALELVLNRLPLQLLAVDTSTGASEQKWAMRNSPAEELIPALVKVIGANRRLDERLVWRFFKCRTTDDLLRLLKALRDADLAKKAQAVLTYLVRRLDARKVATLVQDMHAARAHDDIDRLLVVAAHNPAATPAELLRELRMPTRFPSSYADRLLHLVIQQPQDSFLLVGHAMKLAEAGLSEDGGQVITAYAEQCPADRLAPALVIMGSENLRQWRSLFSQHVATGHNLPVLHRLLTELCQADQLEAAGELLSAVERHRPTGDAETLETALASAGHTPRAKKASASSSHAATHRRLFLRFRRTG